MLSAIFSGMHRHTRPAAYADKRMQQHHTGSYRPGSQGFSFTGEFPDELTGQPVDVSGQRRRYAASEPDRLELASDGFHERVQKAYERLVKENKKRFLVVDASRDIETIAKDALEIVLRRLIPDRRRETE